jgi:WD40 repeat protein
MTARLTRLVVVPLVMALAGCGATTSLPSVGPSVATPSASPAQVPNPEGRILYMREGSDGVEHYFTISTAGTNEQTLFTAEGCGCALWSADGSRVLTLSDTGHDTFSFTTIKPDGSDRVVLDNPIQTLNLAPGASTADGRRIVFAGWDETEPTKNGLYISAPDLSDLRLVLPLQAGWLAIEPFGVTPDGSKIVFFAETGPAHAGHNLVVNADGGGLRQVDPPGSSNRFLDLPSISLSPDGRQAAFGVDDGVWVVDLAKGEARRITDGGGFVWAVSWSPTREWIAYSRKHDTTSVVSLVRPDGTDQHEISADDASDQAAVGTWSPDGKYLLVQRGHPQDQWDLWIMDLEGTFIRQVTHDPSSYGTYSWAPAT